MNPTVRRKVRRARQENRGAELLIPDPFLQIIGAKRGDLMNITLVGKEIRITRSEA